MASDYGLNFGFRRSDESMATREGRFKTPATGSPLLQGSAVELDPAKPGYLKQSAAAPAPITGLRGLLVQEESHIMSSVFVPAPGLGHDSIDLGACKLDQLSVMWAGVGTKVWFRNTAAYSRGTRSKPAVTMVDVTGLVVGDNLGWDGSKWVEAAGLPTAWMTVTLVSGTAATAGAYVEAVVTF
jgi:hypothetical protein